MAIIDKKDFMKLSFDDLKKVDGGTREDFWKAVDEMCIKYGVPDWDALQEVISMEDYVEILLPAWMKDPKENTDINVIE